MRQKRKIIVHQEAKHTEKVSREKTEHSSRDTWRRRKRERVCVCKEYNLTVLFEVACIHFCSSCKAWCSPTSTPTCPQQTCKGLLKPTPPPHTCKGLLKPTPPPHTCKGLLKPTPPPHTCKGLLKPTPPPHTCKGLLKPTPPPHTCKGLLKPPTPSFRQRLAKEVRRQCSPLEVWSHPLHCPLCVFVNWEAACYSAPAI